VALDGGGRDYCYIPFFLLEKRKANVVALLLFVLLESQSLLPFVLRCFMTGSGWRALLGTAHESSGSTMINDFTMT
jgi:hypothetical protein